MNNVELNRKMKTKIAIPTREHQVDDHFGHCAYYTIFTVDEHQNVVERETLPSPEGCGCKSNIASVLEEKGVQIMLAGHMGDGAKNVLEKHGLKVIRGCKGEVEKVIQGYLHGFILDSGESCRAQGSDHQCTHHS